MSIKKQINQFLACARRECNIMLKTPIYFFCMVAFPVLTIFFFTSLLEEGIPEELPVGIVDLDNTTTTRALVRRLDAFQTSRVTGYYSSPSEARRAMQKNKIYAFLYIPKGTTSNLVAMRQPKVSFYYSSVSLSAGSMLMRDLKTITTLGSAAVGQGTMRARGFTDRQIQAFLQPFKIDLHAVNNPYMSYNFYISTFIVPGIILLFIFLMSAYSIGTELKFRRSLQWMKLAGNDIYTAIAGKFLPHTIIWLVIMFGYSWYIYGYLDFPHQGSVWTIVGLNFLAVMAGQGFGVFIFGLMPSLRMSMSVCSLWGVLSFSMCGAAFPVFAMDSMLNALANLFPLRHYYMFYQICVFNGYPWHIAWFYIMALAIFIALPLFVMKNIRKAMLEYVYIP